MARDLRMNTELRKIILEEDDEDEDNLSRQFTIFTMKATSYEVRTLTGSSNTWAMCSCQKPHQECLKLRAPRFKTCRYGGAGYGEVTTIHTGDTVDIGGIHYLRVIESTRCLNCRYCSTHRAWWSQDL
jgi:hypothetical protein